MIRYLLALVSVGCLAGSPDDPYDAEQYTQCASAICWSHLGPSRPLVLQMNRGMQGGPTGPPPERWTRIDLSPYVPQGTVVGMITIGGSIAISGGTDPNCAIYVYLRRPGAVVETHAIKATKSAGVGGTRTPWQRAVPVQDNAIEWKWRATSPPWPDGCTAGVSGAMQWYLQE